MKGWIKLYRKIINSIWYFFEPFDRWHAMVDLFLLAQTEPTEYITKGGTVIKLNRGELHTTLKTLQDRWQWGSRRKVENFLERLKIQETIQTTSSKSGTVISLINYDKYQGPWAKYEAINEDENEDINEYRIKKKRSKEEKKYNARGRARGRKKFFGLFSSQEPSYDLDEYENQSIFDD